MGLKKLTTTSQMLKGILDGCILSVLASEGEIYGYQLSVILAERGLNLVREGSIYPLLLRLEKTGLIKGEVRASPSGPNRKYYRLTPKGEETLAQFKRQWKEIRSGVENILRKEEQMP